MQRRRHGTCRATVLGLLAVPLLVSSWSFAQPIVQTAQLLPGGFNQDHFGARVALDGTTLVVGVLDDDIDGATDQGSAYVYVLVEGVWVLEARLLASDGAAGDQFGTSVAIDGNTVIIGAPMDDVGANANQGSAYVFVRSGTTWTQQQRLSVAGAAGDEFGWSVAVSGDRVLVGAPYDDVGANEDQGTAYSFVRSHGVWTPEATFKGGAAGERNGHSVALAASGTVAAVGAPLATANGHAEQGLVRTFVHAAGTWSAPRTVTPALGAAGDHFGVNVAIDGRSLIAGAPAKTVSGRLEQGTAFVFVTGPSGWVEQARLVAGDGAEGDLFGIAVAIDGDTALIGSSWDDVGANANQGSAYVFTRSGSTWTQRAQLTGPAGETDDYFGGSVALAPGVAVVGAAFDNAPAYDQGSVTVFTGGGATWTPTAWLTGMASDSPSGFGDSVATDGSTIVVGAPWEDIGANLHQGAAYVYIRSGLAWTLQARLVLASGGQEDNFGDSVAISGDTLVVGKHQLLGRGGAAHVFVRSGTTWSHQAELLPTVPTALTHFGWAVGLSGNTVVVGAPCETVGANLRQGVAYVFTRSGTIWSQQAKLSAANGAESHQFGEAVAVSSNTILVGAPRRDAAYVFYRSGAAWSPQGSFSFEDAGSSGRFGESLALSGDTALVGAPEQDLGAVSGLGAAHVYTRTGSSWEWQGALSPAEGVVGRFGWSVALNGDTALVSILGSATAPGADPAPTPRAAFLFLRSGTTWERRGTFTPIGVDSGPMLRTAVALSGDVGVVTSALDQMNGATIGSAAVFSGLCQSGIDPASIAPSAAAGSRVVTIDMAQSSCAWSTTSQAAWLTVNAPGTGTGDGAVTVRYTANTGPARTGTMTIAGQTFTVNQASGCVFTLAATEAPAGGGAGAGAVSFTATNAACPWTAASNVGWMSVEPPSSGTGSSSITYSVLPNPGPARVGTLTVAGKTFTVTQASGCSYALTPTSASAVAAGGRSTLQVTASDAMCTWSASSHVAWLSAPIGYSGIGSSTFTWAAAANVGPARTGTMTIAGKTFTVNQAGGCTYTVTPTSLSVSSLGGFASLALVASDGACSWTAVSHVTWAAITSPPGGSGSTTVNVGVEPNTGAARGGTLTVAGRTITVDQAAWGCTFGVSPLAITAPAGGASGTVLVTAAHAGCAWTVGAAPSWITFPNGSSGSGSASLAYVIAPNLTSTDRQVAFTVGGYAVAVTQAASTCGFSLSPTSLAFPATATTKTVTLSAGDASCRWTASTAAAWLVVSPESGTGGAILTVLATANDDTARNASLTVAGTVVPVLQDGSATPAGAMTRYLAEGATGEFFDMRIALLNTGNTPDEVTLRYLTREGATPSQSVTVPPLTRATVWPKARLGAAEFSTVVESSGPIVVDRTMTWDARGYGSHAETAVAGPALEWFLAEGATHSGFDLFYLVQNPGAVAADVEVRYLRPAPQPQLTRTYAVPPNSRFNIWVDYEGAELADTDVSAVIRSTNGQPIIVERAMYKSAPGHFFDAGHESAGVTRPATTWLLAEGATGPYFDLFVLLANPDVRPADVRVTYLLPDGTTYTKTMTLAGESRSNIWVDYDTPDGTTGTPLADTAVSTTVEVTNGVPIIVERAMWWPTGPAAWHEAHNSAGATAAGTRWALADGEVGGPTAVETYILIANTSPVAGQALVTLLFEDGTSAHRTYALPARSRTNVPVKYDFVVAEGRRFGALVESLGEAPVAIVVERAMYSDAEGVHWAAGNNALATRLR